MRFIVGLVLFAASLAPSAAREPPSSACGIDLGLTSAAEHPVLVIDAVSCQTCFRTNLNRERFDRHVSSAGSDYVLRVTDIGTVREACRALAAVRRAGPPRMDEGDLRYRIELRDGNVLLGSIYATAGGDVLDAGGLWTVSGGERWMRDLLERIVEDMTIRRRGHPRR